MRTISARTAYTALELLVVIALIAVLVGIIVPAVQQVRTAAAKTQCLNKLKQIGLAHQNYHATYHQFPPGISVGKSAGKYQHMTWCNRILPFLEQDLLWQESIRAYEIQPVWWQPPHPLGRFNPAFVCPVDDRIQEPQIAQNHVVAFTSYLGVIGISSFRKDGVLYVNSQTKISDIVDGTSHTLLVGERPPSADLILGWWYAGIGQNNDGSADMLLGVRDTAEPTFAQGCPSGPYEFGPGQLDNPCDAFHYWSLHPGGSHFLLTDGSTHFLRYPKAVILPPLATRAGGENFDGIE